MTSSSKATSTPSGKLRIRGTRFQAMGSPCGIQVYSESAKSARDGIRAAMDRIAELERKYSRYLPDNLFARVNQAARTGGRHPIDPEFAALLDYADACYQNSGGLFDITSGVLRKAWDFRAARPPEPGAVERLMEGVGWQHVEWSQAEIRFARKNMEIDFGGIVKEYAADAAGALLEAHGLKHGMLDLGGDIKIIGPHPDGSPWNVGVRHASKTGELMASVDIHRGAMATSGDYERCMVIDGVRYSHILNPRTGWPVSGLTSVSVIADQCVVAGSSCTIAMLKEREGLPWLDRVGLAYVAMDVDGRMFRSDGEKAAD